MNDVLQANQDLPFECAGAAGAEPAEHADLACSFEHSQHTWARPAGQGVALQRLMLNKKQISLPS